jgi:uncharacterized membrane protein YraQ (UPF0718 family)
MDKIEISESTRESKSLFNPERIHPTLDEERFKVTRWIIIGYFILLLLQILIPIGLLWHFWQTKAADKVVDNILSLINGLSAVIAVFGGLVGVAIGFYFRDHK